MKFRITKRHWRELGGLANPKLARRQDPRYGHWTYWRIAA